MCVLGRWEICLPTSQIYFRSYGANSAFSMVASLTSKVRLQPHVFLAFGLEKRKPPPTTWRSALHFALHAHATCIHADADADACACACACCMCMCTCTHVHVHVCVCVYVHVHVHYQASSQGQGQGQGQGHGSGLGWGLVIDASMHLVAVVDAKPAQKRPALHGAQCVIHSASRGAVTHCMVHIYIAWCIYI